eukprot:CAMPEP_0182933052 /NCGR_PEP_ID=MMETSP0105_2-20130417/32904_1 /TAXON_ID=81532 ORGANISM="Acanthoeca-like sp., Strain 10tr" /NCGR_SAMPLE_ID=MMETSP0105_2 /ASSEMBLY_ACC=CAM_ASM_000205 /LENGTH=110 /DNA_ID=CAMNT_0025071725 /DNA_START=176 /DNA_END=504 /DNA_ORIENTATION=-
MLPHVQALRQDMSSNVEEVDSVWFVLNVPRGILVTDVRVSGALAILGKLHPKRMKLGLQQRREYGQLVEVSPVIGPTLPRQKHPQQDVPDARVRTALPRRAKQRFVDACE